MEKPQHVWLLLSAILNGMINSLEHLQKCIFHIPVISDLKKNPK